MTLLRVYILRAHVFCLSLDISALSLSPLPRISKCLGSLNVLACYGHATLGGLLTTRGLFWKRALLKRPYSAKETYNFKEPSNQSHPITHQTFYLRLFRLLHWDSTDGDEHNDVRQHVWIRQTLWLRLVDLWRGDASNRYITRMQTLTHTHTHTHTHACTLTQSRKYRTLRVQLSTHPPSLLTFTTICRYLSGYWGPEFCIHSELSASTRGLKETFNQIDTRPKQTRGRMREREEEKAWMGEARRERGRELATKS